MVLSYEQSSDVLSYRQQFSINAFLKPFFRQNNFTLDAVIIFGEVVRQEEENNIYLLLVESTFPGLVAESVNSDQSSDLLLEDQMSFFFIGKDLFLLAGRTLREQPDTMLQDEHRAVALLHEVARGYVVWFERETGFVNGVIKQSLEQNQERRGIRQLFDLPRV